MKKRDSYLNKQFETAQTIDIAVFKKRKKESDLTSLCPTICDPDQLQAPPSISFQNKTLEVRVIDRPGNSWIEC